MLIHVCVLQTRVTPQWRYLTVRLAEKRSCDPELLFVRLDILLSVEMVRPAAACPLPRRHCFCNACWLRLQKLRCKALRRLPDFLRNETPERLYALLNTLDAHHLQVSRPSATEEFRHALISAMQRSPNLNSPSSLLSTHNSTLPQNNPLEQHNPLQQNNPLQSSTSLQANNRLQSSNLSQSNDHSQNNTSLHITILESLNSQLPVVGFNGQRNVLEGRKSAMSGKDGIFASTNIEHTMPLDSFSDRAAEPSASIGTFSFPFSEQNARKEMGASPHMGASAMADNNLYPFSHGDAGRSQSESNFRPWDFYSEPSVKQVTGQALPVYQSST